MQDHLVYEFFAAQNTRLTVADVKNAVHVSFTDLTIVAKIELFLIDLVESPAINTFWCGKEQEMPVAELFISFVTNTLNASQNSLMVVHSLIFEGSCSAVR
jgi:hypothetical protein